MQVYYFCTTSVLNVKASCPMEKKINSYDIMKIQLIENYI